VRNVNSNQENSSGRAINNHKLAQTHTKTTPIITSYLEIKES